MNRILRLIGGLLLLLVVFAAAGLLYVRYALPDVGPPPELTIRADSAQIARGQYLAHHVALCVDCHSTRDWSRINGPMVAGTEGKGGEGFLREWGFPGNYYAPNITPAHLGTWSDGEIYRAITTGVSRDGHALFPVMPYKNFGQADRADVEAIIAYIRSLKPIENKAIPASVSDFPMTFILNTIPGKNEHRPRPNPADELAYGSYLTSFAGCSDCHTPVNDKGEQLQDMYMAGGREFPMPGGTVRAANLTPHASSGMPSYTKEAFVARFRAYANTNTAHPTVGEDGFNSVMPWTMYGGMTEQDLGAIYTYLKSLKPVDHRVERFSPKGAQVARL
ncbi:c-type cytochrome [Fibrivirga algicola]|uniref:Cytochrome c n=1 Tax=Fibrivirga algicola TaxID=2950420 RepID=A0ABX0QEX1_9BACT|nr:cytochrome C [Fibrivirga algicola]ARK10985.1 cytochrome C [Fibrella sp. ES10-3-2-2]NID09765.1 cytochrome c [Fibrivirga algicola]